MDEDIQAELLTRFDLEGLWRCVNCGQRGDQAGVWGFREQKVEHRGNPIYRRYEGRHE